MSLVLRSLSRTTVGRTSRFILVAPRPTSLRFLLPGRHSAASYSTHEFEETSTPSGHSNFTVWCIIITSLGAAYNYSESQALKPLPHENKTLRHIIQTQFNIYRLPLIDLNNPCELLHILEHQIYNDASDEGLATESRALFTEFNEYIHGNTEEMQNFQLDFKKEQSMTQEQRQSRLKNCSEPVKFKVLLANFCFEALDLMRRRDRKLAESVKEITDLAENLVEDLMKIVQAKKSDNPSGKTSA